MKVTYNPYVFEQPTLDLAKAIIVTPEDGLSTEHRWAEETPYLADLIGERLDLREGQMVLDYGCGIGRIAKALIARFAVRVLGVDISQNMRAFAPGYVQSPVFSAVSNEVLGELVQRGFRADAAIAVWVLQHCMEPHKDAELLRGALRPGAPLFVLNNHHRAVPTLEVPWVNDGVKVQDVVAAALSPRESGRPDPAVMGDRLALNTFWATYVRD